MFKSNRNTNKKTYNFVSYNLKFMKNSWILLPLLLIFSSVTFAQKNQKDKTKDYINKFKQIAIKEMNRTGIPASITLAQGILESGWGKSRLATLGNNHFGIKCHKGWKGGTMKHDDDAKDECFRTYKNAEESYKDHSEFLTGRGRYAFLFDFAKEDYKNWAKGLKKAGYATNPKYADLLIAKIEQYNLNIYDKKDWKKRERAMDYNKLLNTGSVVYNYQNRTSKTETETVIASANPSNSLTNYTNYSRTYNSTQPNVKTYKPKTYNKIKPVVEFRKAKKVEDKVLTNDEINDAFESGKVIAKRGSYNKLKYATLKYPASPYKVAKLLKVSLKDLLKWNEVSENYRFPANGKIYLEKKRTKPVRGVTTHTVKEGETMLGISNMYGVKVLALYLRNKIKPPKENNHFPVPPKAGTILNIKKPTAF